MLFLLVYKNAFVCGTLLDAAQNINQAFLYIRRVVCLFFTCASASPLLVTPLFCRLSLYFRQTSNTHITCHMVLYYSMQRAPGVKKRRYGVQAQSLNLCAVTSICLQHNFLCHDFLFYWLEFNRFQSLLFLIFQRTASEQTL